MSWYLHILLCEQYEQQKGDIKICLFAKEAIKFHEMELFQPSEKDCPIPLNSRLAGPSIGKDA